MRTPIAAITARFQDTLQAWYVQRPGRAGSPRRALAGMSLIEVMVAMAILGIMMTMMYSGFVQTANNKKRVEARLERNHEIRMGLERIARELSMAYVSTHRNSNPSLQPMITAMVLKDSGGNSRIDFTSFGHLRLYRDAHESDQNELGYFVTEDPEDSSQYILARREQRRIDDDPLEGGETQVLIGNIEEFRLEVLDPVSLEWGSQWDTTQAAMQLNRLPMQAKILITVPNLSGNGPPQTFGTRTHFPLQFGLNHATYNN